MTYYIKDSILPVDEDEMWEFKAHRNFSSDEVPAWHADGTKVRPQYAMHEFYKLKNANRTRQPISRNLCGFLNAGKGGTILIGVLDNGKVVGTPLNALQKDHLLLSLEDALRRFIPRVPTDFVKVAFIPVIDNKEELQDVANPKICEPSWEMKRQAHQLRTSSLCWCDMHTMQRFQLGFMPPLYVVEVRIAALHPKLRTPAVAAILSDMMKDYKSPVVRLSWPAFTSEDGNLFCRVLNSLIKFTEDEITQFNYCQTMDFLRKELSLMETDDDVKKNQRLQFLLPGATLTNLESILKQDFEEEMAQQQDNDSDGEPASPDSTDNHVVISDLSLNSTSESGFNPNISSNPDASQSDVSTHAPMSDLSLNSTAESGFNPNVSSNPEASESSNIFVTSNDSLNDTDEAYFVTISKDLPTMKTEADFVLTSENNCENLSSMKTTGEMPESENALCKDKEDVESDNLDAGPSEDLATSASVSETDEHELDAISSVSSDMSEQHLTSSLLQLDAETPEDMLKSETPASVSEQDTISSVSRDMSEQHLTSSLLQLDAETPEDVLKSEILASVAETDEHELDAISSVSSDMSEQHLTSSLLQLDAETPEDMLKSETLACVAETDEHELDAISSVSSDMSEQHLTSPLLQLDAETPEDMLKSEILASVAETDEHELDAISSVSSDMSEQHLTSSLLQLDDDLDPLMEENRPLSTPSSPTILAMLLEPRPKSANK